VRAHVNRASAERELIRAMLAQRSRIEAIAERIGTDAFRDERYRAIFTALLSAGDGASLDDLAPMLDPETIEVAEQLLEDRAGLIDAQRTIDDSLAQLEVRAMEERLAEIDGLSSLASDEEKAVLDDERRKLVSLMRASGKMSFKAFRRGRTR
jgi:replicative DNA helicase